VDRPALARRELLTAGFPTGSRFFTITEE
jgi:hypothetical protein